MVVKAGCACVIVTTATNSIADRLKLSIRQGLPSKPRIEGELEVPARLQTSRIRFEMGCERGASRLLLFQ
jgi:hypothetical protein